MTINPYLPETTPAMNELLIRMDERVKAGFEASNKGFADISTKLDKIERRGDDHDERIQALERDLSDREDLKNRFFQGEKDLADARGRLAIIENTEKNRGGFWSMAFKVAPLAVSVILTLSAMFWQAKHTEAQVANLQRAPAAVVQHVNPAPR